MLYKLDSDVTTFTPFNNQFEFASSVAPALLYSKKPIVNIYLLLLLAKSIREKECVVVIGKVIRLLQLYSPSPSSSEVRGAVAGGVRLAYGTMTAVLRDCCQHLLVGRK